MASASQRPKEPRGWTQTEVAVVPLLSDLTSGFGNFFPSPELHRKIGLALAFAAFGLVASASSIVLLTADQESDPRNAFAGAHLPAPAAQAAPMTAAGNIPAAHTVVASKADMAEKARSCPHNAADGVGADCASASTRKPDVALADPPAAPKTPISHDNVPTVAAPPSAAFVAGAQTRDESVSDSTDGAAAPLAAAALPPATVAAKPRKTARHASRHAYHQMSLWPFEIRPPRGGYARQRSFFW
jgi:hypothetical protein